MNPNALALTFSLLSLQVKASCVMRTANSNPSVPSPTSKSAELTLREPSKGRQVGDVESSLLLDSSVTCSDADGSEEERSKEKLLRDVLGCDPVNVDGRVEFEVGREDTDFVHLAFEGESKVRVGRGGDVGAGHVEDGDGEGVLGDGAEDGKDSQEDGDLLERCVSTSDRGTRRENARRG
jgi:hypothetical protein